MKKILGLIGVFVGAVAICVCTAFGIKTLIQKNDLSNKDEINGAVLSEVKDSKNPDKISNAVYKFHHELAVLSKNMLLPLLYHSFKPESTYLWTMSCRKFGCMQLLDTKMELYATIMERNLEKAINLTNQSIQVVFDHISSFIS